MEISSIDERHTRCILGREHGAVIAVGGSRLIPKNRSGAAKPVARSPVGISPTKIEIPLATFSPRFFLLRLPPADSALLFSSERILGRGPGHDWLPAYFRSGSKRGVRLTTVLFKHRRAGNKGRDNEING